MACIEQRRRPASATEFLVFADAAFALDVAFVFDFIEKVRVLHVLPNLLYRFVFDVSDSVGVVVAAGDGVAVFRDAKELAEEAPTQEEVVEPVVEVGHAALFCHSGVKGNVYVDCGFAVVACG